MPRHHPLASLIPAFALALFTVSARAADDTPPSSTPGSDAPTGRHHHNDPAWAACKKQAEDQKLERGEARHEFMKNCMKSAQDAAPPAS